MAELLRSELWTTVTNDGVRYAAVFEMALHFPDGRQCLFIAEFFDSPVVEEVIGGDELVADHKDVHMCQLSPRVLATHGISGFPSVA